MKQEAWITGHVNAYRYFGGVTRILTPDNLKTGVLKTQNRNSAQQVLLRNGGVLRHRHFSSPPPQSQRQGLRGGLRWVVSTWILAALRNRQFPSLMELNQAIR